MRGANGDASRPGAGLGLALLATALLAGRLAEGDLIGDPVIYAAVAKSMLVRGEWTTLYLAGQPFFDKPRLVVWLAVLAAYWLATPGDRRPPLGALAAAALAFLAVVLPWHLYETWVWGWRFVHGYLSDVSEKMGRHPGAAVYARALVVTTLPWLPLAAVGAWRSWRSGERGDGLRLLTLEARGDPGALRLLRRSRGRAHGRRSGRAGPPRGRHAGGDRAARRARARGRRPLRGAPPLARLRRLPGALTSHNGTTGSD